jgi:hypothetical protein
MRRDGKIMTRITARAVILRMYFPSELTKRISPAKNSKMDVTSENWKPLYQLEYAMR